MHHAITIDATPMFADVFSGSSPRPTRWVDNAHLDWRDPERIPWWHWAAGSHAGRAALQYIHCDVNPAQPWTNSATGWRVQPWENPWEDSPTCWHEELRAVRAALGEPLAGTFFAEVCGPWDPAHGDFQRSHRTLIAINDDGTRAAVLSLDLEEPRP